MVGFIFNGLTYQNYSSVCSVIDIGTASSQTWHKLVKQIHFCALLLLSKKLKKEREKCFGNIIIVKIEHSQSLQQEAQMVQVEVGTLGTLVPDSPHFPEQIEENLQLEFQLEIP